MFGFFTLVSLVVAYTLGGWWWAGFAVMFLNWLGKRQEAKEKREAADRVEELEDQAADSDDGAHIFRSDAAQRSDLIARR